MASPLAEIGGGVRLLGQGLGLLVRRPRLFWLGALPPLITSVLFTGLLVLLVVELRPITDWLTPFADDWSAGAATAIRVLTGLALIVCAALVMVLTFTTLTLALGSPLYDQISAYVDRELGGASAPEVSERLAVTLGRALAQSAALIAVSLAGALVFLLVGLIPVAGQIAAAVGAAVFGGWMIMLELVGSAAERRGQVGLADRRRLLRTRRLRVLGLGVPTFWLLSIPFVGVAVFPVATAAATLLVRQLRGEPTGPRGSRTG